MPLSYCHFIVMLLMVIATPELTFFAQDSLPHNQDGQNESAAVKAVRVRVGDEAFTELLVRLNVWSMNI
ncbi:MAG: hypothetical protein P8X73_04055 [Ignavibacteriaceae bacterium]|jgi:hypothetical protein